MSNPNSFPMPIQAKNVNPIGPYSLECKLKNIRALVLVCPEHIMLADMKNMTPQIGMLDLQSEYRVCRDEIRAAIDAVLESQQFIGGPAVGRLEHEISARFEIPHVIAVSSGTDALLCSLMALEIGPGDEVIVPSLSFFATAGCVSRVGATPVFLDIDPRTFHLDAGKLSAAVTQKTRAIIVVHLYGQCAEMDAIQAIAERHGLAVIKDAAQAIGAKYKGRYAGRFGDVACFSFYPSKNLGGFGEGGMIWTHDDKLAAVARQLRNHGESGKYVHERVGGNFRLDTIKAAILLVKLRHWEAFTRRRREVAARYDRLLEGAPVTTPYVAPHQHAVYHQYVILCERRDELSAFLREHGIATAVYYPIPLHLQKCFSSLGYRPGSCPVAEQTCATVLSLPCHPMLSVSDVEHVATSVCAFYDSAR